MFVPFSLSRVFLFAALLVFTFYLCFVCDLQNAFKTLRRDVPRTAEASWNCFMFVCRLSDRNANEIISRRKTSLTFQHEASSMKLTPGAV